MANVRKAMETLVLGLLAEQPAHAYQLRKSIDSSIGHLHKVSDGMLYPLLKDLSEKRLISGSVESTGMAPDKRVFKLEEAGRKRIRELLSRPLECANFDDKLDFAVRYFLFSHLAPEERETILRERLAACDIALERLARATDKAPDDPYRLELICRVVNTIENEVEWLATQVAREASG